MNNYHTLLCWHSDRAGLEVLEKTIKGLKKRKVDIRHVIYLEQKDKNYNIPKEINDIQIEVISMEVSDPTCHKDIYNLVKIKILPRIKELSSLHINTSPGTPAMHSVWLILHAGGRFPIGTQLWSSQFNPDTQRTSIRHVDFSINTYLSEIHTLNNLQSYQAVYDLDSNSIARQQVLEKFKRYAMVNGAPLLILGERGIGKTRLVETIYKTLKQKEIISLACGGLDSELADSLLFGHCEGAFTGALKKRDGLLKKSNDGVLFLDEVQDLPKPIQRKLVRVFQDTKRRFRPLGSDKEESVSVDLVCASNQPIDILRKKLDPDLFDRLTHLIVELPPLRDCREDIEKDWKRVWRESRHQENLPVVAPWNDELKQELSKAQLLGNMRDLQRLAVLLMAWWTPNNHKQGILIALKEWKKSNLLIVPPNKQFGTGSRKERIHWFQKSLSIWAKDQFGTWKNAAKNLECDEKTLRQDYRLIKNHEP